MSERSDIVKNFMDGNSFTLNPLTTLKFIAASSFFGEPSYYRDSDSRKDFKTDAIVRKNGPQCVQKYMLNDVLYRDMEWSKTAIDIFISSIDRSLNFDFKGTLELAKELRTKYNMRANPNIIFVRAALHPSRPIFNKRIPIMRDIGKSIICRPDDITTQFLYYTSLKGSKKKLPGILKRIWADKLSKFSRYHLKKYLTKGKIIDLVRVCHANSEPINELMKTGNLETKDDEKTWEVLRADGKTWKEIISQIKIPHMALLRNLRGMSLELGREDIKGVCETLVKGVEHGKQFPYRYYSAYNQVEDSIMKSTLEECIDKAMANFPKLKGRTISLCDNSGSAHGTFTSSYGSTNIATIANLSGVMTAINSDSGQVGVFGDRLYLVDIDPHEGVLRQLKRIEEKASSVGQSTENGIWLFFRDAIKNKTVYDNIFIYSDQQAGHGGLYGLNSTDYSKYAINTYIDVLKLVEEYRRVVNSNVNIFSVQVAGYDNSVIPENIYRGAVLSGWTGNEVVYAKYVIDLWNNVESNKEA